ncbi:MAG TPA: TRAP transporter substrate-binding protein [Kiloniellales bacterium]|nr:TRAP transporter substrate-binding protein [Kiloniellales bacterium]
MNKSVATLLSGVALVALSAGVAQSQELPDTELTFVGSWSGLSLHRNFEQPFWGEHIPEASDGAIQVEVTTFDQMGLGGGEVYRLLSNGVFDMGATVADYTVEDSPELEGLDMPIIAPDAELAWEVAESYKPVLERAFNERFDSKLISVVPYPAQVVFCNVEITSLADLEGKQIRASGRSTAEFLEALGAEGITLNYAEVPGALQRGVVDCAVTGSLSGYSSGWHEVSTHLLPLPIGGWDHVVTAMNLPKWESLDPQVQEFLLQEVEENFERPVWETAVEETEEGVACLTGQGECTRGDAGSMVLVEVSEEDFERGKQLLTDEVLPRWAARVDQEWVDLWNDTIGAKVGLTAERR